MKKEELIDVFMEFVGEKFPELIEEEKAPFNDGDTYYYVPSSGGINEDSWDDHQVDKGRLSFGNVFKTQEEAEFVAEKLKVIHELEALGSQFDRGFRNYYLAFDYYNKEIFINFQSNLNPCFFNTFFNSEEDAQKAVDEIGEYRINKYLFGAYD